MIGRSYATAERLKYQESGTDKLSGARFDSGMGSGASTPEELETLLEDAFVLRDGAAVADLFEPDGLMTAHAGDTARGAAIGPFVAGLWEQDLTYLARPARVLQAGDTGLILAERVISIVRRRDDHWRYAISLLHTQAESNGGTQQ